MWRAWVIGALVLSAAAGIVLRTTDTLHWYAVLTATGQAPSSQLRLVELLKVLPAVCWTAVGAVLATLRPRNALGWLFLAFGAMQSFVEPARGLSWDDDPVNDGSWSSRISETFHGVVLMGLLVALLPLYPDGRLPSRRLRLAVAAGTGGTAVLAAGTLFAPAVDRWHLGSLGGVVFAALVLPAAGIIGVDTMRRWERQAHPYRGQLAWLVGCVLVPDMVFIGARMALDVDGDRAALLHLLLDPLLVIPIGVAVGVLRYRLLGIQVVLRRGLVYGTLTTLLFTVYLGLTAVLGSVLDGGPFPGVVAAAVVAVILAPARDRLSRVVDRLVHGAQRDPLDALAGLSNRVAAADQASLLSAALTSVAVAVRADGAAVVSPSGKVLARTGTASPEFVLLFPLRYGGKEIGELRVANARDGERYSKADRRLLPALAAQIAVVAHATELTEALETERNRVVEATRHERNRLRQDLHDGLGPSLTGMGLGLQALAGMVPDPPAAAVVERLRTETDFAVQDIRRLIDDLRPAVLDTAGLAQAVERHARSLSTALPVDVTADDLPALAPDVEAAAYRIVAEALSNAARHADAHQARVVISAGDALHIAVSDDGRGIPVAAGATAGVGLTSMRHRAESLGGEFDIHSNPDGTTVTATLPLKSGAASR